MRFTINESQQAFFKKVYYKRAREVLYKTALPVIELSDNVSVDELKQRVPMLLKPEQMSEYLIGLWSKVGGRFASDTAKRIRNKKSVESPDIEGWEEAFRAYASERSLVKRKTKEILSTEAQMINDTLDRIVRESGGSSVQALSGAIKEDFITQLVTIQTWEAERIARTEVIGASNKGSYDGAKSTGEDIKKGWSTSGLPGIRPTHLLYESFGWVHMDKEFTSGLLYPGDPNGEAGEIINCRCTIIYNVD